MSASIDSLVPNGYGDTSIERKTGVDSNAVKLPPKIKESGQQNILNSYRSYNYIFTLAALKKGSMEDPTMYKNNKDYFVVAKSGGKGTEGLSTSVAGINRITQKGTAEVREGGRVLVAGTSDISTTDYSGSALVSSFNKNSPGRFDMFIDNVQIETIMGFSGKTNTSIATKLTFDLFEPFSMSGFIEALQVSAVASGYDQYINCPYMLKMEFIGYKDDKDLADAEIVPNSTRYFVFSFTGLEITVDENGARYKCNGVPHNERGFGEPAKLKSNIQITGTTVGEILKSLQDGINQEKQDSAKSEKGADKGSNYDEYEIVFPAVNENGVIAGSTENEISISIVSELLKSKTNYKFADPGEASGPNLTYDPKVPSISFADGQSIQDCIAAIIRDSNYTKKILNELPSMIDSRGMVNYFIVNAETIDKEVVDETSNKPYYKYRYVVMPYKLHYSRIPLTQSATVGTSNNYLIAKRTYNYLYTGKNVDIEKLKLQFNTLFFQAIPKSLGNKEGALSQSDAMLPAGDPNAVKSSESSDKVKKQLVVSTSGPAASQSQKLPGGLPSGSQSQTDPYHALAINMHQAILDNVDQCTVDMDIIGDPFYLVTSGMGNGRPIVTDGITDEGEAAYTSGDVMVLITFKNPVDIDEVTGETIFNKTIGPYSGLFRVINVVNRFKDGVFRQSLNLIRIPGQLEGATSEPVTGAQSQPDPTANATPIAKETPSGIRQDENSALKAVADATIPSPGLPGALSSLVKGASTVVASVGSVAGLANQIASAASGNMTALQGLSTSIPSTLRMVSSGLTSLSAPTAIAQAGASIESVTQVAKTLSNTSNISATALASAASSASLGAATNLTSSAMSSVNQLGSNAAGLINGVASKVDALKGTVNTALNTKLTDLFKTIPSDVDLNVLPGISLDIPKDTLANIPASQPQIKAPIAEVNTADIDAIIAKGGSLAKLAGSSFSTAVTQEITAGLNSSAIGAKLSTMQKSLSAVSGSVLGVESAVNSIRASVPAGLPTMSSVASSVSSVFGSKSSTSPLATLVNKIQSNSIGQG